MYQNVCLSRDDNLTDESPPLLITPISQSPELNGINLPSHHYNHRGAVPGSDSPDDGGESPVTPTNPSPHSSRHERNLSDGVGMAAGGGMSGVGAAELGHKRNLSDSQAKAKDLSSIQVCLYCVCVCVYVRACVCVCTSVRVCVQ